MRGSNVTVSTGGSSAFSACGPSDACAGFTSVVVACTKVGPNAAPTAEQTAERTTTTIPTPPNPRFMGIAIGSSSWPSSLTAVPRTSVESALLLELRDHLQHLVGRLNRFRVRLKCPFVGDHVDHLRGQIDVRLLERAARDRPAATGRRGAHGCETAGVRLGEEVLSGLSEAFVVGERRDRELADRELLAVRVRPRDDAV